MYKWWHADPKVEQIWDHIDLAGGKEGISIIENDIQDVAHGKLIGSITNSWNLDSVLQKGKLGVCAPKKCGSEFDPMRSNLNELNRCSYSKLLRW